MGTIPILCGTILKSINRAIVDQRHHRELSPVSAAECTVIQLPWERTDCVWQYNVDEDTSTFYLC